MSEMDFSGFDDAAAGALVTDLDVAALDGGTGGMDIPDPIDGADVVDMTGADGAGMDVDGIVLDNDTAEQASAGPTIVASDGTAYGSYTDFLRGPGRG